MYSEKVLEHFARPRNVGELDGATVRVEVSNPVCGDVLRLAAIIEGGHIRDVRFLCRGCTASIACGSLLTEKMMGAEVAELAGMSAEMLEREIGGLEAASKHAAVWRWMGCGKF